MNNIEVLKQKIRDLKLDIAALVNNTVLFILAWVVVFWVFQFFTILPAYSVGIKMIVYNTFVDFNPIDALSNTADLFTIDNNIYNIFLSPLVLSLVFGIVALIFLIKWNSDRLNMRRLLFWIVVCSIIRIGGNFIFGLMFDLLSWNVVTDNMGLTSRVWAKWLFAIIMLLIMARMFISMSKKIKFFFNPYITNRFDNLSSNVFLPVLIGCVFITICDAPYFFVNEIGCMLLLIIMTIAFMCYPFMVAYRGMYQDDTEEDEKEKINIIPILILFLVLIGDIILMQGIHIENKSYDHFFFEEVVLVLLVIALVVTFVVSAILYRRRKNRDAPEFSFPSNDGEGKQNDTPLTQNQKIAKSDKYKNAFNDEPSQEDETDTNVDMQNADKYGFKRYDLKKYDKNF
jgi:hypothetical protein